MDNVNKSWSQSRIQSAVGASVDSSEGFEEEMVCKPPQRMCMFSCNSEIGRHEKVLQRVCRKGEFKTKFVVVEKYFESHA